MVDRGYFLNLDRKKALTTSTRGLIVRNFWTHEALASSEVVFSVYTVNLRVPLPFGELENQS